MTGRKPALPDDTAGKSNADLKAGNEAARKVVAQARRQFEQRDTSHETAGGR